MSNTTDSKTVKFEWNDALVREFVITYNKIDKLISGVDPIRQTIEEWKQSKLKEAEVDKRKTVLVMPLVTDGWYQFVVSDDYKIPEEKYEAVKQAIEQVLNNEEVMRVNGINELDGFTFGFKKSPIFEQHDIPTLSRQDNYKKSWAYKQEEIKKQQLDGLSQKIYDKPKDTIQDAPKEEVKHKQMWNKHSGVHNESILCMAHGCEEYNPLKKPHY